MSPFIPTLSLRRGSALEITLRTTFLFLASFLVVAAAKGQLPAGFVQQDIASGWQRPVGLVFGKNPAGTVERTYVWEQAGRVWVVENGVKLTTPFLDIREEVGMWRDYGLLGFCLDPNFQVNGYVYLLYVVDRHHLDHFGTPAYNPNISQDDATIGRLTRYTADSANDYRTAIVASRTVLLGETRSTGFPILHQSHGAGSLLFGTDGTLLVSTGDGASYTGTDDGGPDGSSMAPDALATGIITAAEDIGSFRSQSLDSLSGKVLRLDPATGDGVPSNPFYQAGSPRSASSRVWAYGARNPCRMALKPGTGEHHPEDGDPGHLIFGDVGWNSREEMNLVDGPGINFGWPLYEGYDQRSEYWSIRPPGMDAVGHRLPRVSWRGKTGWTLVNGNVVTVGTNGVQGNFWGDNPASASIGGVFYTGTDFPPDWRNTYYHADFSGQWIRAFDFDANGQMTRVRAFLCGDEDVPTDHGEPVVFVTTHPETGGIYFATVDEAGGGGVVRKIRYLPNTPTAVASVDQRYGASPLTVHFSSAGSTDPQGGALQYSWNFGDGGSPVDSTQANPTFTFTGNIPQRFDVQLTVTDPESLSATATVWVWINNTPPSVAITSPAEGYEYPMGSGAVSIPFTANVSDAEHANPSLTYGWESFEIHNEHLHLNSPLDSNPSTSAMFAPEGCSMSGYFAYKIRLTVTDPLGLATTVERHIQPNCNGSTPRIVWNEATDITATTATLNAVVDPNGSPTSVSFQYGTTPTFGTVTSVTSHSGPDPVTTSRNLTSLIPGTTYHYRVRSTYGNAVMLGPKQTFTTLTRLQDWRRIHFNVTTNTGLAANDQDPDGDGLRNLMEFGYGLNPLACDPVYPEAALVGGNLSITVNQPANVSGITYHGRFSFDLVSWAELPDLGAGNVHIFTTAPQSPPNDKRCFLEVLITEP